MSSERSTLYEQVPEEDDDEDFVEENPFVGLQEYIYMLKLYSE